MRKNAGKNRDIRQKRKAFLSFFIIEMDDSRGKRCKKSSNCEIAINTPLNKKKFYSAEVVFGRL